MKKLVLILTCFLVNQALFAQGLDTLQLKTIFSEPYLPGVRPNMINFSPDGKKIYYTWNDSALSKTEYYETDFIGKKTTQFTETKDIRYTLSPDGKKYVYTNKSDVWLVDVKTGKELQLTKTKEFEFGVRWSPDSKRIAFVQDGDVFVMAIDQAGIIKVTNKKEKEAAYSVSTWLGNSELLLTQSEDDESRKVYFPEYVGKMVKPGESTRGLNKITVSRAGVDSSFNKQIWQGTGYLVSTSTTKSGSHALLGWLDPDMKSRTLSLLTTKTADLKTVFVDSTLGWIDYSFTSARFSPNDDYILFESEQDGWNHLYTLNIDGTNEKQLTRGAYEVSWFDFLSNDELILATSAVDPGERHIYTLKVKNGELKQLTKDEGFRTDFRLSPDNKYVVYEKTIWNDPFDLFTLDIKKAKETRISNSVPERFKSINWQKPNYWRFTGRDGVTKINMTMIPPKGAVAGKSYPVVVFVHGAGSLQNVYKGWSTNYWREYMFHQFLTEQGYAVIEVDYRHSTGYGRKFREDVTNWMGKFETNDIVDGLDYAQKQVGYLNLDKVGIYGGSYGGFMALYAVSTEPNRFHAAAALRAVTNWENYYYANPWYTQPRLGTPEKNPEHYKRSSPLSFADTLKRPVYILHGLIDNNVGFQDAVQYVERLIQTGNERFDMMMYPSERHSFSDPDAWYDEYRRIYHFFKKELK